MHIYLQFLSKITINMRRKTKGQCHIGQYSINKQTWGHNSIEQAPELQQGQYFGKWQLQ